MKSREELRNRKRRIIWNNDGDDLQIPARFNTPGFDKDWIRGAMNISPADSKPSTTTSNSG